MGRKNISSPSHSKHGEDIKASKSDSPIITSSAEDTKHRGHDRKSSKHGKERVHEGDTEGASHCNKGPAWNDAMTGVDLVKLKNQLPRMSPERLDEDFYMFASHVYAVMKDGQLSHKQFDLATKWLSKLLMECYADVPSKRNRNIYLSNLLLQISDGALAPPLLMPPPTGPLPNASIAFQLSNTPDSTRMKNALDKMLNPKDYIHQSTDGRTYLATKALDGNAGMCAYIGVSVGGGEPVWIKPTGEQTCVPERDDLIVMDIESRGDTAIFKEMSEGQAATVSYIASKRKAKTETEALIKFYNDVLKSIHSAIRDPNTEFDGPSDKLLQQLIHTTRCEMRTQGIPDTECTFSVVMKTLERKMKNLLESAIKRSDEIERITNETIGNEPKLVDLSSLTAFQATDDIWKAAVTEEPNPAVISRLDNIYPKCVVEGLLMLLERQRQIILDQEKKNYDQLEGSMKAELLFDVKDNVVANRRTQRDLTRLSDALPLIQKLLKETPSLFQLPHSSTEPGDNLTLHKSLVVLSKQVATSQKRMELARQRTLEIEDKIDEVSCRITDVETRIREADDTLRADTNHWSEMICQMNAELKNQAREIDRLSKLLNRDTEVTQGY